MLLRRIYNTLQCQERKEGVSGVDWCAPALDIFIPVGLKSLKKDRKKVDYLSLNSRGQHSKDFVWQNELLLGEHDLHLFYIFVEVFLLLHG